MTTVTEAGRFFFAANVIACAIVTFWTFAGIRGIIRLIQWKQLKRDALSTTLVFALLACFWTAVETGQATRHAFQVVTPDDSGSKMDKSNLGPLSIALS